MHAFNQILRRQSIETKTLCDFRWGWGIWLPDLILYVLYSYTQTWMLSCSVMSDSFVTPWTAACQVPLSMGFSRQGFWSGLSFPSPGDLPDPGIEPLSYVLARRFFITEPPGKPIHTHAHTHTYVCIFRTGQIFFKLIDMFCKSTYLVVKNML